MKKFYSAPSVCSFRLAAQSMICSSPTTTLHSRDGVRGEEADSRSYGSTQLWDDTATEE